MLSEGQIRYLSEMDPAKAAKPVKIFPYDPRTAILARRTMDRIHAALPEAWIRFLGASALGIAGLNDVDIYIYCEPTQIPEYEAVLRRHFGPIGPKTKWRWHEEGIEITVKLADPTEQKRRQQMLFVDMLTADAGLRSRYEALKMAMDGKPYGEYYKAKMEFFSEIVPS